MNTCSYCAPGLGQNESLVRQTAPVWGTLALLAVLVVPAVAWLLYREKQEGRW